MLTGKDNTEPQDQATALGTNAFIQGSFTGQNLQNRLCNALAEMQYRQLETILTF